MLPGKRMKQNGKSKSKELNKINKLKIENPDDKSGFFCKYLLLIQLQFITVLFANFYICNSHFMVP